MRILFAAPRKTGDSQLRCLLASAYGFEPLSSRDAPEDPISHVGPWLESSPNAV